MTTLTPAQTPMATGGMLPAPMGRGPALAAAAAGTGMTGADFLRVIRQRLVLILFLWIFFTIVTAVVTWLMVKYYPKFRATAYIRVQSITPVNPMEPLQTQETRQDEIERLLQDQAIAVKSPEVLLKVLEDPEVRGTVWFKEAEEAKLANRDDPLDLLDELISAEPVRESNYLAVSAAWKVQSEVATLVNETVDKYMAMIERQQKDRIRKAFDQLSEELNRAKTLYEAKQKDIDTYRQNEEVLGTSRDELKEKLLTLTALETELQMDMLGKRTQYEQLQGARPEDLPITPDLQAMLNADPRILQLDGALQQSESELNLAKERFGENHRQVKALRAARDAAAQRVQEERNVRTLQYHTDQIDQSRRNYLESQQQLVAVKERLQEARAEQQDKDQKYAAYLRLEQEAETLKAQYEQLVEQRNLLQMTLGLERTVQITVQSSAIEPKSRASPQYYIWIPAGALLGLALAVGFALLLEMADKSVRTVRDVQRAALPVLASIPATEDEEIEITRVETAALDAPHSITAEAFRTLRANLFFSAPAEQQGVLLVTSPSAGNGKTTVAVNLAISIALSGRRVLLIDANFRRPSLPRLFPGLGTNGLSNILIGQAHLDDVVAQSSVPGMDVLASGPLPPNPAELLGGSYLRDMFAEARGRYDQIIIDGPPVLLVSDAMVLAGVVDGVILVCQYRATSRGALQRTQNQLEAISARVFGAVLNKVETRAGGYFRKAYREFYEYHEPVEEGGGDETKKIEGEVAGEQLEQGGEAPSGEASGATPALAQDSAGTAAQAERDALAAMGGATSAEETPAGAEAEWGGTDIDTEIASLGGERILDDDINLAGDEEQPRNPDEPNPRA